MRGKNQTIIRRLEGTSACSRGPRECRYGEDQMERTYGARLKDGIHEYRSSVTGKLICQSHDVIDLEENE